MHGTRDLIFRQVILCGENPVTDTFCDLFELLKMQELEKGFYGYSSVIIV